MNKRVSVFFLLISLWLLKFPVAAAALSLNTLEQVDESSVPVEQIWSFFNRRTNARHLYINVTNNTAQTFPADQLYIGIHDLEPAHVSVGNPHGISEEGVPYLLLDTMGFGPGDVIEFSVVLANSGRYAAYYTLGLYRLADGNMPPRADAGSDRTVQIGDRVTLDGAGSFDADGDPLGFDWVLSETPAGSGAILDNPTTLRPALDIDLNGAYRLDLTVNDGIDDSAPDPVWLRTDNSAPVADAGSDQTATVGLPVNLDGSASHDVDGDSLTFAWSLGDGVRSPITQRSQSVRFHTASQPG